MGHRCVHPAASSICPSASRLKTHGSVDLVAPAAYPPLHERLLARLLPWKASPSRRRASCSIDNTTAPSLAHGRRKRHARGTATAPSLPDPLGGMLQPSHTLVPSHAERDRALSAARESRCLPAGTAIRFSTSCESRTQRRSQFRDIEIVRATARCVSLSPVRRPSMAAPLLIGRELRMASNSRPWQICRGKRARTPPPGPGRQLKSSSPAINRNSRPKCGENWSRCCFLVVYVPLRPPIVLSSASSSATSATSATCACTPPRHSRFAVRHSAWPLSHHKV
ncbi:hypothetical protein P154DRAFT_314913, partial [Amniculicola lignicola CBS 123094]